MEGPVTLPSHKTSIKTKHAPTHPQTQIWRFIFKINVSKFLSVVPGVHKEPFSPQVFECQEISIIET